MPKDEELKISEIIDNYTYEMRESSSIWGNEWDTSIIKDFLSDITNKTIDVVLGEKAITAYKLLNVRRDGSIGPLFIGKKLKLPINIWMPAEDRPTKGYAHRPGWHSTPKTRSSSSNE